MTQTWTRRQLLRRSGTAAVGLAGVGLVGCGARVVAGALSNSDARATTPAGDVQHYVSRPDLTPPVVTISKHVSAADDPKYIFFEAPKSGGHGGLMILDRQGELVWFGPDADESQFDFQPQMYKGEPVLTYFEGKVLAAGYGRGVAVVADTSYRPIYTISAHNGLHVDIHEVFLTPQDTALVTAYRTAPADLSALGGPSDGYVLSGVLQEIDVRTGKLVFEWDSLDHVDVTDSYLKFAGGTQAKPYDYFHINSLSVDTDGDLIIGARNTWAVYKIGRRSGEIIWQLNGKKSDFTMGEGTHFWWQHHSRTHGGSGDITTMSLFDDGANPPEEHQSRALVLELDTKAMTATLKKSFTHPGKNLLAVAMGSAQLLPDGRMFVGWGTAPYFSEFAPDGTLLLDGSVNKVDPSYRTFTANWVGRPVEPPDIAARSRHGGGTTVYASWNGATEVASWKVLAGKSASSLAHAATATRAGFETVIPVASAGPHFAVEARNRHGHVLSRSAAVRRV